MFKLLRNLLICLFLVCLGGVAYYFWTNPVYQRQFLQKAEEVKEQLKEGDKKFAWSGPGLVSQVVDGDTVVVETEGHPPVTMRLAGIDAPELAPTRQDTAQPLSQESKEYLAKLVKNQPVHLAIVGADVQKRPVVLLTKGEEVINAKMVEAGLAEAYEEFLEQLPAKTKHAILNAELAAKASRLGIWGLTNYQRPFEYRIRHRVPGSVPRRRP